MPCWSRPSATLAIALLLASCGDDGGFSPTGDNVSGSYSATTFTVTSPTGPIDLLASGASMQVTLAPEGTTTGRLLVPAGNGGGLDEDLRGIWILTNSTVTISPIGPALIRDVQFTAARDHLTGERILGGETIRLVLTRNG